MTNQTNWYTPWPKTESHPIMRVYDSNLIHVPDNMPHKDVIVDSVEDANSVNLVTSGISSGITVENQKGKWFLCKSNDCCEIQVVKPKTSMTGPLLSRYFTGIVAGILMALGIIFVMETIYRRKR